ncbi:metal ABC transporter substrate-binding protein [Nocardioides lianchengensis]|uniref:Zinc transport system substrate-binding protein n=1 Tax=Nocardioides lianchengensis TaxID=1045774 RepID=A0A1G6WQ39_9ACTN|nr:metal ABC transporter substrate-binding protein [Nocardioides lianchengensis]NYG09236.1 zinc transport system substrate-binding protein [Nocardioides lianchengensis]SDD67899.1 zinc transport system substrate-binding protein [Nocardioides lianchengensis]
MQRSRLLVPALAAVGALSLTGCAAFSDDSEAAADSRTVAVGLYPLEYVAARVAGDAFDVENLTTPGGEPHDLTLDVKETATIADSALLVYVDSLQPAVDDAAEEVATGQVLDAADVVDLLPFAEEEGHEGETAEEHAEHADEEGHAEEEGHVHGEEEHDHGEYDPHFWQDPLRMAELGDAIAGRLGEIDPDQKDTFAANAADLRTDLEELDASYADGLAQCTITTVVTNHDAFGYLEKYGLHLESITGITPDAEPTPAALADLQELIKSDGITTVFSESLVSPKSAETLASDVGVQTEVLDTLEGLTDDTADEDYLSLMRQNLTKLEQANRC